MKGTISKSLLLTIIISLVIYFSLRQIYGSYLDMSTIMYSTVFTSLCATTLIMGIATKRKRKKENAQAKQVMLLLMILSPVVFVSCGKKSESPPPDITMAPPPAGAPSMRITDDEYIALRELGEEPGGYGLYTYALLTRTPTDEDTTKPFYRRYTSLVNSITSFIDEADSNAAYIPNSIQYETNLFCLPSNSSVAGIKSYNYSLAKKLASSIAKNLTDAKLQTSLRTGEGPFLISITSPYAYIWDERSRQPIILSVDLSKYNPESIAYVVKEYRGKVFDKHTDEPERMKSFTSTLLTFIQNMDEHIEGALATIKIFNSSE